ncbi:MAG: aminotransferase class V-fold PLP-dependent enzyme [Bacteriovorax sp.]|nr:aminotransferase class V-fold PLP-dependent enzyme [Bacteriovorax sp.]
MNYFDHAATTFIYPEVLDLLNKSFKDDYANPNSQHLFGANLLKKIDAARSYFLEALKANKDDMFVFTSSATESNNTVVRGLDFKEGDVIYYSKADHPSLVEPIEKMAILKKLKLKMIPFNKNGFINIEEFKKCLEEDIKLVALTHVNNQSGVINDIGFLSKLVKENTSAHVHIDAAQSFSKITFDVFDNIDSVSITSHKVGGPKGIAGLFLKKNHKVSPLLMGGGQEGGFRSSTQAYPLIIAFEAASKISFSKCDESILRLCKIREIVEGFLTNLIPQIKFPFENTSPYILTFILPGISSDVILRHLESRSFCLSSTSACSSKIKGFNPTLAALNIPEIFHKNVLRLSFSHDTCIDSVNLLLEAFGEVWNDLKFLTKK